MYNRAATIASEERGERYIASELRLVEEMDKIREYQRDNWDARSILDNPLKRKLPTEELDQFTSQGPQKE